MANLNSNTFSYPTTTTIEKRLALIISKFKMMSHVKRVNVTDDIETIVFSDDADSYNKIDPKLTLIDNSISNSPIQILLSLNPYIKIKKNNVPLSRIDVRLTVNNIINNNIYLDNHLQKNYDVQLTTNIRYHTIDNVMQELITFYETYKSFTINIKNNTFQILPELLYIATGRGTIKINSSNINLALSFINTMTTIKTHLYTPEQMGSFIDLLNYFTYDLYRKIDMFKSRLISLKRIDGCQLKDKYDDDDRFGILIKFAGVPIFCDTEINRFKYKYNPGLSFCLDYLLSRNADGFLKFKSLLLKHNMKAL